jgi:type IV secretory pathway VirB4 component
MASKATQSFVPVKEVRNGVVLLKDGGYRGILMCSSINFSLKSEDEQRGIIGGFQTFLNSLDFSVQIVVHSRKMDIRPYLQLLNERMDAQSTELMRLQLREYIAFIENFVTGADIMTKTFYVVVPYAPSGNSELARSLGFGKKAAPAEESGDVTFEEHRVQLEQRMSLAASGLAASGLRAIPLGTEEIIELLYRSFNLGDMENPIRFTNS